MEAVNDYTPAELASMSSRPFLQTVNIVVFVVVVDIIIIISPLRYHYDIKTYQ